MAFDTTVHQRNRKGEVVSTKDYRLEIVQGMKRYERPVHSGIWYNEDGTMLEESKQKIKDDEIRLAAEAQAKEAQAKAAKEAEEQAKIRSAQGEAALAENAALKAKLAELEKRAKS